MKKSSSNIYECFDKSLLSKLGRILIKRTLNKKGFHLEDLSKLPQEEARQLIKEACMHASLKLVEIDAEARSAYEIKNKQNKNPERLPMVTKWTP